MSEISYILVLFISEKLGEQMPTLPAHSAPSFLKDVQRSFSLCLVSVKINLKCLYPDAADIEVWQVIINVNGGPGRDNVDLLAYLCWKKHLKPKKPKLKWKTARQV